MDFTEADVVHLVLLGQSLAKLLAGNLPVSYQNGPKILAGLLRLLDALVGHRLGN